MDPQLVITLAYVAWAVVSSAGALFGFRHRVGRVDGAHRVVADSADLTEVECSRVSSLNPSSRLRARSGPLDVEIVTDFFAGEDGPGSVIAITGLAELSLVTEGVEASLSRSVSGVEIHVGDPVFDDALWVRGPEAVVRAVLDAETRRLVLSLFVGRVEVLDQDTSRMFDGTVSVGSGVLRVEALNVISAPKWFGESLLGFLDVARRLARPADVPGRLAANARNDPLPEVRLENLQVLIAEYPGRPATVGTLRSALDDSHPDIRLWGARELGEEGRPVLLELASSAAIPETAQAEAIWALGEDLPRDVAFEVLFHTLRSRRLPVAEACLESLGPRGGAEVVSALSKVLAVERGWLAAAAARALGGSGEALAEESLLAALDRTDEGVGVAAAEALGRVGTASAVAGLREAESASDDDDLRRAAREAIARIQERLTGASPGQLSLAEDQSGQLSLTEDEAGRMTLHENAPGDDLPSSHK